VCKDVARPERDETNGKPAFGSAHRDSAEGAISARSDDRITKALAPRLGDTFGSFSRAARRKLKNIRALRA
jgi:hypothetical protein